MGNVTVDGATGDLGSIAWAYVELFHHDLPAAISRYFTAGTPPGSMMSRAITATADVLADLFVDLVERWTHLDEFDRTFHIVVLLDILHELGDLKKLNEVTDALPTRPKACSSNAYPPAAGNPPPPTTHAGTPWT
ncbi:MAG: hypothetical protein ACRDVL_07445 [Acidimicrobiia bacterium]